MPIRLIDPNAEIIVKVSGTDFHTTLPEASPSVRLTYAQKNFCNSGNAESYESMVKILSAVVKRIDHPNCENVEQTIRLLCMEDILSLAVEITNKSALNKDESKN